jgi:MFS family permease
MDYLKKFSLHTFSSLKIRNFRLFFTGQAISLSGTWMQTIAQDWLVLKLSGSGTILGAAIALQFLPILLFGPFAGVLVDRFPKRKLLYFTQASAAILALILGIFVVTGYIRLWMIFIFAPLLGLINSIDSPTRQTFIFDMVGKEQISNAVALNSTIVNLARVIGPTIAGILIATVGLASCFLFNAISYIPVLIMLFLMNSNEMHHPSLSSQSKPHLRDGFRYVLATPKLRNTLIMMTIIGTFSYEFSVVLPLLAQFTFHGNAASYAALISSMGLGSVAGGLVTAGRRKVVPHMLVRSALFFGFAILIASILPNFLLVLIMMFFIGFFSINFLASGNTTLQIESKPEMRGRVMSLWAMAFLGSTPIGGPIIGWICEHAGPRWGLVVGGIAAITAAMIGLRSIQKEKQLLTSKSIELQNEETLVHGKL